MEIETISLTDKQRAAFLAFPKVLADRKEAARNYWKTYEELNTTLNPILRKVTKVLGKKYSNLLRMRLLEGKSLETCGKEYGVTRERIRQLEEKAMNFVLTLSK
jgi:DNA-directed RNA polymerase sigma subunit (sigma70/sigma32)